MSQYTDWGAQWLCYFLNYLNQWGIDDVYCSHSTTLHRTNSGVSVAIIPSPADLFVLFHCKCYGPHLLSRPNSFLCMLYLIELIFLLLYSNSYSYTYDVEYCFYKLMVLIDWYHSWWNYSNKRLPHKEYFLKTIY